ncbi:SDR family oxidoreductase [Phytohabitans houttuyneae]|uniref:NAD(P)-dependent oxidoreductase n=1 Tax=Phytohabitans houttuyneae TaxID=1076126 RepID=A0A6V8KK64_9ACTN|nr:SDR family oxidoreductase [Phytohabitans houttuyneae]GFJ82858.1 NAD(P)-dependent oxidoreductase [Phytohabitans houttuyneae]
MRILVTGATGYVGGRLAPRLAARGHEVRCLTRAPERLADVPWASTVEVVRGDVGEADTLTAALSGVDVAYYLVHSLGQTGFEAEERRGAENFAAAARAAGVRRIVYLGGPAPDGAASGSAHLRSRETVARTLLGSGVPTVVLRAAVILGSGSASFEMLRYLTERLPVMVAPRWVRNRVQPIAVRDVLHYLVAAADLPDTVEGDFAIGGPDVLTFADMMRRYARVAGLSRRVVVPVRPLTPRLSAYWVGLVTPVPGRLARPLVQSLVHEAIVRDRAIAAHIPDPPGGLTGFEAAVRLALASVAGGEVETRWSTAAAPSDPLPTDPGWAGGTVYTDERGTAVAASPARLWAVIESIGGETGWYSFPLAWAVRGWLDKLAGGAGLRRGRRHPTRLYAGEALDFWRVEALDRGRLLRLRAEMRLPGRAWLEMRVAERDGEVRYEQRAVFLPRGLPGHLYWWAVAPFHAAVFGGMVANIARTAEKAPARDG